MPSITVSDDGYANVQLLARAWDVTEDEVITRLVDNLASMADSVEEMSGKVAVFAIYQGERVEAVYDTKTRRVEIKTGALAGSFHKSPSGAACAVVKALNPDVAPNRNGWTFWSTEDGRPLFNLRPWVRRR